MGLSIDDNSSWILARPPPSSLYTASSMSASQPNLVLGIRSSKAVVGQQSSQYYPLRGILQSRSNWDVVNLDISTRKSVLVGGSGDESKMINAHSGYLNRIAKSGSRQDLAAGPNSAGSSSKLDRLAQQFEQRAVAGRREEPTAPKMADRQPASAVQHLYPPHRGQGFLSPAVRVKSMSSLLTGTVGQPPRSRLAATPPSPIVSISTATNSNCLPHQHHGQHQRPRHSRAKKREDRSRSVGGSLRSRLSTVSDGNKDERAGGGGAMVTITCQRLNSERLEFEEVEIEIPAAVYRAMQTQQRRQEEEDEERSRRRAVSCQGQDRTGISPQLHNGLALKLRNIFNKHIR